MRLVCALAALLPLAGCRQSARTLDLTASLQGQQIVLSWPQTLPGVQAAILSITDSGRQEAVQLNLDVVRQGRIAYRPVGGDVVFHLAMHDFTNGRSASGSARVIIRGVPAARKREAGFSPSGALAPI
jgi:hypothetical protein